MNEESTARINVPNGRIIIGEKVDQKSVVEFYCKTSILNNEGTSCSADSGATILSSPTSLKVLNIYTENPT